MSCETAAEIVADAAYAATVFYIDGETTAVVRDPPEFGWATRTTNKRTRNGRLYHSRQCLGVYECPRCEYRARPIVDERVLNGRSVPNIKKRVTCRGRCATEDSETVALELRECAVSIVVRGREDGAWEVRCSGAHGHARPPALKLTPVERARLNTYVDGHRGGGHMRWWATPRRSLASAEHPQSPLYDRGKAGCRLRALKKAPRKI